MHSLLEQKFEIFAGIGPKRECVLKKAGIHTWNDLLEISTSKLTSMKVGHLPAQIQALQTALQHIHSQDHLYSNARLTAWLRNELQLRGLEIVSSEKDAAPSIITIALKKHLNSKRIGEGLEKHGYILHYHSEYLLNRNWIQICLMGEHGPTEFAPMIELLEKMCIEHGIKDEIISENEKVKCMN